MLKQVIPDTDNKLAKAYLFGITGGVLGLFFNAVLIDVFEASKVAETLWIFLGIAAGVAFLYRKEFEYKKYIVKILTSHLFTGLYLFILTLVFYLKSLGNFFVADDFTWLKWAATTNLNELPKLFVNAQGFFYRPVDKIVMYFLYTLFSFSAPGYHLFTLITHFLIAVGVYILINRLFKKKALSFVGAFIFLFLPSQGEVVFWISTISTNLATLFIVYMLIFWMNFRNKKSLINYAFALLFAVLAIFSYEGAIILILPLILFDLFITRTRIRSLKTMLSYLPFAVITVLYPIIRILAHTVSYGGDYAYSIPHLIPNFIGNFIGYLGLMTIGESFLPLVTVARNALRAEPLMIGVVLALLIIVVMIATFVLRNRVKKLIKNEIARLVLFAILFMFVALIPYLGLGNIAERYTYLASVGFAILIVVILDKILNFVKDNKRKVLILAILMTILGGWYYSQNRIETGQWAEAGRITGRTLGYLRLYYDGNHPNSNFYFVDLPIRKAQAWIFPAGSLSDGVWFIYRDDTIKVEKLSTIDEGKVILATSNKLRNFVFAFDKNGNIYAVK